MRHKSLGLLLGAVLATGGACAGGDSGGLRNAEATEALQDAFGEATLWVYLGNVQFQRKPSASGTSDSIDRYPMYQAVAGMDLVRLDRERDLSGSFTGWDDWFLLTQAGVQRVATVTLLPEGERIGTIGQDRSFVRFVCGEYRIERVISNERLEINGEQYSQVIGTQTFDLKPEWRDAWVKSGETSYRDRRVRALFKYDPVESQWKIQVVDVGPREEDFPTANVPKAIANLRSTGVR